VNKRFYDFGEYRLDTHNQRLLHRSGETITLTLKEFELLFALVTRAGDVVSKDALLDAVWKDVAVAEETLTRNISWLRKKLGAAEGSGNFIETIPKRGYRFTAQVTTSDAPEIIVEEQTVQRIRIEETIAISEPPALTDNLNLDDRPPVKQLPSPVAASSFGWKLRLAIALGVIAIVVAGFAVLNSYLRRPATKAILVNRVAPFSGLPGREDMPAFSPDGKQIVFAWNGGEDGDNFDIYVKIIGAGDPVRLTSDARDDVYPRFSPDNRFIAFVRNLKESGGEVILIPALGGAERRVCGLFSGNYSITFSPDGRLLAVIDAEPSGVNEFAVHTVNLQTGEKRRVTAPAEFRGETTPRFSPDGKYIAFVRIAPDASQDLFVVEATGGAARQLTFDRKTIHNLAWEADGQSIVFTSLRGNVASLWRIASAGGEPEMIATSGKNITNLSSAPDGKTIAYVEMESQKASIWRVASGEPPRKFIRSLGADQSPQFSADGKHIVFMSDRTGAYEIWLADADGKNQRQLTFAANQASSPRFSPDGKFVVYYAQNGQRSDIFIVPTEVGEPRLLSDAAERKLYPSWSADGKWIYFTSNRTGDWQLWKIPADASGEAVQITWRGAHQAQPAPDGKTIYYSKENAAGLWRVPVNGGDELPVAELSDAGLSNSWSVTSAGIYFIARAEQPPYKTKFYDFSTAQTKETLGVDKLPPRLFAGFSASADGKTFLYALFDQNASSIMLAEVSN
jgi:Tol biopolymer transport system component/DNA-binding winged helix-turn-helix (wHTH) protein